MLDCGCSGVQVVGFWSAELWGAAWGAGACSEGRTLPCRVRGPEGRREVQLQVLWYRKQELLLKAGSSARAGRRGEDGAGLVRTGATVSSAGPSAPPGERDGRGPRRCREVWTGKGDRHSQGRPHWKARAGQQGVS